MVGIDRRTGARLSNFDSALQAVEYILGTRLGSVILLREFGGGVVELLGRLLTADLFLAWCQLVATAIDEWEPRFKVRRVYFSGSVEEIRTGIAKILIEVDYRPKGHLGDYTVQTVATLGVNANGSVVSQ